MTTNQTQFGDVVPDPGIEVSKAEANPPLEEGQGATIPSPLSVTVEAYRNIAESSTKILDQVSEMADRGSGNMLMGFGAILVAGSILLIVLPNSSVDPVEYIALIILAGVLIIGGALARLYVYRDTSITNREIRQFSWKMLEQSSGFSNEVRKNQMQEMREIRQHEEIASDKRNAQIEDSLRQHQQSNG